MMHSIESRDDVEATWAVETIRSSRPTVPPQVVGTELRAGREEACEAFVGRKDPPLEVRTAMSRGTLFLPPMSSRQAGPISVDA